MKFFIGQRVIYSNTEIVTCINPPRRYTSQANGVHNMQWIELRSGIEQYVSALNLKPLPGGQL